MSVLQTEFNQNCCSGVLSQRRGEPTRDRETKCRMPLRGGQQSLAVCLRRDIAYKMDNTMSRHPKHPKRARRAADDRFCIAFSKPTVLSMCVGSMAYWWSSGAAGLIDRSTRSTISRVMVHMYAQTISRPKCEVSVATTVLAQRDVMILKLIGQRQASAVPRLA